MTTLAPAGLVGPESPDAGQEESALWRALRAEGTATIRERIFSLHSAFARTIARRYHRDLSRGDIDIADFQQLAYAGLLEAIDRFDPDRGVPFRGFATRRISGSILDGLPRMSEMREQISCRQRMRRERVQSLVADNAAAMDLSQAMATLADIAVGLALGFILEGTGLVVPADEGERAKQGSPVAYETAAWREIVDHLGVELARLPTREQAILRYHYLESIGFEQLASLLGISKARVSQLHRAALNILKKRMAVKGHFRLEK